MAILHLPDEIILNILHWIQDDQSARTCFAKANKVLASHLLRSMVEIEIRLSELMELSEQLRFNILQKCDYLHLNDDDDASIPLTIDIKRAYSITSKRVELVSQLKRVHTYRFVDGTKTELTDVLRVLSEKTRFKSLTVKEVVLVGGELEEISVIEGLEALKIILRN
eukprot:gene12373-14135_t